MMENWEELLKNRVSRFRGENVPEQDQQLWNKIEDKLGATNISASSVGGKGTFTFITIASVTVALGTAIGLFLLSQNKDTSEENYTVETIEIAKDYDGADNSSNSVNNNLITKEFSSVDELMETLPIETVLDPLIEPSATTNANEITKHPLSNVFSTRKKTGQQQKDQGHQQKKSPNLSMNKPQTVYETIDNRTEVANNYDEDKRKKVANRESNWPSSRNADYSSKVEVAKNDDQNISMADLPLLTGPFKLESTSTELQQMPLPPIPPARAARVFGVRIFGGPTFSHFALENENKTEQNDYFQSEIGSGGGLALEFKKWSQLFTAGIAWNTYIHSFQISDYQDTSFVTQGIQAIEIDILTGDTLDIIYGDVQVQETRQRYFKRYNRYNTLTVPLEWSKNINMNRMQLGVGLGVAIQIRTNASGSILNNEDQVVRYSDDDLPKGRVSIMPTGRIHAGYYLGRRWRVDVRMLAGFQRYNSKEQTGITSETSPVWKGQLINGQLQFGLTRFLVSAR
ncbi:MAG: hypothetical protein P8O05_07780 [Flavobacteriales bacterium]|nr:hypothetical protein [Flavobacteriales bacterium]